MLDTIFNKLIEEGKVIKSAPWTFGFVLILGFILMWIFIQYTYKERLDGKNDLLDLYRERLGLTDRKSPYASMRNKEVRAAAIEFAAKVRAFKSQHEASERSHMAEAKREDWNKETAALLQRYQTFMDRYNSEFKADALLLADEIISRLPADKRSSISRTTLEHPTNPIGCEQLATQIETAAKSLP